MACVDEEITIAIHQPNFLPWMGWFDKFIRSDRFVLLDHVQFPKTGGTWINRSQVLVQGTRRWLTVPVKRRYSGVRPILEIEINDDTPWRRKMKETLRVSYGRAPFFDEIFPQVEQLIETSEPRIADYNIRGIKEILNALDVSDGGKIVRSSALGVSGTSSELLLEIVRAVGGRRYLSGEGAKAYLDETLFQDAGIGLSYQSFHHPRYQQHATKDFVPGLSIVDALFNRGFDGVKRLLQGAA